MRWKDCPGLSSQAASTMKGWPLHKLTCSLAQVGPLTSELWVEGGSSPLLWWHQYGNGVYTGRDSCGKWPRPFASSSLAHPHRAAPGPSSFPPNLGARPSSLPPNLGAAGASWTEGWRVGQSSRKSCGVRLLGRWHRFISWMTKHS